MEARQLSLFDPIRLARRNDPDTSQQAAAEVVEEGVVARMAATAISCLQRWPDSTASELEAATGLLDGKIRKRLNDLRRLGRAEKSGQRPCRVTGRMAYTWRAVEIPVSRQ
jgi:hypothetical protein